MPSELRRKRIGTAGETSPRVADSLRWSLAGDGSLLAMWTCARHGVAGLQVRACGLQSGRTTYEVDLTRL